MPRGHLAVTFPIVPGGPEISPTAFEETIRPGRGGFAAPEMAGAASSAAAAAASRREPVRVRRVGDHCADIGTAGELASSPKFGIARM